MVLRSPYRKVIINISFCCSCFCCCVWCSPRYKAKTLQVLVMFSFMSFIYHSIMDAISIGFMLLIEVIIITLAFLYISVILFVVSFLMINNHLHKRSLIKCLRGSLMLVTVFSAVMLLLVMYMNLYNRNCWDSYWTGTIRCSVCCLLVHQEKAAEGIRNN